MKRSLLTVLLVVFLIGGLFLLTGCGEKKDDKKPAENTSTNNSSTNNSGTEALKTVDFYVQNLVPDTTIKELYASPAGSNEWSPNLLGDLEMVTGTQAQVGIGANNGSTSWDLKVVDEEGTALTFPSADLSTIFANNGGTIALQVIEGTPVVTIQQ